MILPLFQVASAYPTASSAIPQKHSLAGNSVPRQSRKRHLGRKSRYVSLAWVWAWQCSDRGLEGLLFAGTRLAARSHLVSRTSSLAPLRDGLGRERDVTELRPPRCSWSLSKHENRTATDIRKHFYMYILIVSFPRLPHCSLEYDLFTLRASTVLYCFASLIFT